MRFIVYCLLLLSGTVLGKDNGKDNALNSKPKTEITIAAASLSHLVEKDQTGIYQKIFQLALSHTHFQAKEIFLPYRRALLEFEHNRVDCTYSFTEVLEDILGESAIISSFPLGAFSFHIFTPKSAVAIHNLEQLSNLTIGTLNGHEQYYLDRLPISQRNKLKLLNNDRQGIEMLKLQRLDAYIGALPDLNPYLPLLTYDPQLVLYKSLDRITCHNTEKNQHFLNELSSTLQTLKNEGHYQAIAGDLYIDF